MTTSRPTLLSIAVDGDGAVTLEVSQEYEAWRRASGRVGEIHEQGGVVAQPVAAAA